MKLLLDTHLLLWAASRNRRLPEKAQSLILDPSSQLLFSVASIWEIAIKIALGKADFHINPHILRSKLRENGYGEIRISSDHALAVTVLPNLHRDPFDRLLVAQAAIEGCTLLTTDSTVAEYPGPILLC